MPRRASSERSDVLVVGAGVSGLTTAVRLSDSGLRVQVLALDGPAMTSSAAAGAIWDPTYAEHSRRAVWATRTYEVFDALATAGLPGVCMVDAVEASRRRVRPPAFARRLPQFRECDPDSLPDGLINGYRYRAPIIDMLPYLRTLSDRVAAADGELLFGERLRSLGAGFEFADVVVNCSGFGARDLVPDPEVVPIRGQLVAVRNPGLTEFFAEHSDVPGEMTYLLPHGEVLLLGGSAERGEPDPRPATDVAAAIVQRCSRIFPEIADAEVLGHRAGIRPSRPQVRLDHEDLGSGRHIVHNYGHGGSGVSLSWGCAEEVAALVRDITAAGGSS
jgi:D-amino-acid oxidase